MEIVSQLLAAVSISKHGILNLKYRHITHLRRECIVVLVVLGCTKGLLIQYQLRQHQLGCAIDHSLAHDVVNYICAKWMSNTDVVAFHTCFAQL